MTQIFINGRYLAQRMTGVQRYAAEVVLGMDRLLASEAGAASPRVTLLAPEGAFPLPALKHIEVSQGGRLSGHLWEQLELPRLARGGLLFNPCGPSPLSHPRQVTMIPDASIFIAPRGYSLAYRMWTRLLYLAAGRRAKAILTISEYSKMQLLEHCRTLSQEKVHVVYPGSEHVLRCGEDPSVREALLGDPPIDYVLCVGSQQANKNIKLVAALSGWLHERGIATVIAGGSSQAVFRTESIEGSGVIKTGYVTDAQLVALYRRARCFIFPSFEEGFGIPPLEAMHCECPVVASNTACMPEVCGEAALYFDPHQAEALKAALQCVLFEEVVASRLTHEGALRAQRFTWDGTALGVWQVLRRHAG